MTVIDERELLPVKQVPVLDGEPVDASARCVGAVLAPDRQFTREPSPRRVKAPIRMPVEVKSMPSGAILLTADVVLGDVLGPLADEYKHDPDRIGRLLVELADAREAADETSRETAHKELPEALDRAADKVEEALDQLVAATVAVAPDVRLTTLQALFLADRLEDATRNYGGWNGGHQ